MSVLISIKGSVQGVGFRPEVCALAKDEKLNGYILNDTLGVKLALDCTRQRAISFINLLKKKLKKNRPLANIQSYKITNINEKFNDFTIKKAGKNKENIAVILPDYAPCKDCIKELNNKNLKRRFNHAFINCTNCGTRYSVIKKIPYDRKNTSMKKFLMCKECTKEYNDIDNRRFYSEVIACNDCGAKLSADINKAIKYLKEGKIVAIKGVGGYNLLCNAENNESVKRLRMLKNRPKKPLAIMCKDIKMAKKYAYISKVEERILLKQSRSILLLKSLNKTAFSVHFDFKNIGIFLPSAPIFYLLFKELDFALVASSANISSEMIYSKRAEFKYLKADFILSHNRNIVNKIDDSVGQVIHNKYLHLRSARGFRPLFKEHKIKKDLCILALGMEEKNEFLIYKNSLCIFSAYIGDIKNLSVFNHFINTLSFFVKNYKLKFDYILADLHPHFLHTNYFKKLISDKNYILGVDKNTKLIQIYHHAAHAMSYVKDNILAFCFDGTGYKNNSYISGSEIIEIKQKELKTKYCFDEFKLLNVKNNKLLAYSIFKKYNINCDFEEKNYEILYNNCSLLTSSLGRIFDAFSFVVLALEKNEFEAHSAMMIEQYYDKNIKDEYNLLYENGKIIFKDIFISCLKEDKTTACSKFLNTIVSLIKTLSIDKKAILSGGIFCNNTIMHNLLEDKNYKFYYEKDLALNDACIALGQLNYFLYEKEFIE